MIIIPCIRSRRHAIRHVLLAAIALSGFLGSNTTVGQAQVTTAITPSPLPSCPAPCGSGVTTVTPSGSTYNITGGARPGNGPNLFHSFGLLSVGATDVANFLNDSGRQTSNILSRVTGGQPSQIFGTLRTTDFGNANLFLINPSGIVFGPKALLDIGAATVGPRGAGSFHASTAGYLSFNDIGKPRFYADPTQASLLATAPVAAFGFLSANPVSISIQGSSLSVPGGQTLSIVGGDISITGAKLTAPSGRVQIVSVASPGEVVFSTLTDPANLNVASFERLGHIGISQSASIDASAPATGGTGSGGTVLIRGDEMIADNATISVITRTTDGISPAVNIDIRNALDMSNNALIISQGLGVNSTGGAGDIVIKAGQLHISNGAQVKSQTQGRGVGGTITISVARDANFEKTQAGAVLSNSLTRGAAGQIVLNAESLNMDQAAISSQTQGAGVGGNIDITLRGNLLLKNNSEILNQTSGIGPGGDIAVSVKGTANLISGDISLGNKNRSRIITKTLGNASQGDIALDVTNLILSGGAEMFSEGPALQGGNIVVKAHDTIDIAGRDSTDTPSGLLIFGSSLGIGQPGNINVETAVLTLGQGAEIRSGSLSGGQGGNVSISATNRVTLSGNSKISSLAFKQPVGQVSISTPTLTLNTGVIETATVDIGRAGDIVLNIGSLNVNGGRIDSSSTGIGPGGNVLVNVGGQAQLTQGAEISATSSNKGNAGNIKVSTGDSLSLQDSSITTEATSAEGGNITITAPNLIRLANSKITATVQGGTGNGGNISIDPNFFILDHSKIIANAFGGNGGNINITAGVFLADPSSVLSASSALGVNGTVNIESPVQNLSGTLSPLPASLLKIAPLTAACAARVQGGKFSSFTVAGRDGIPAEPGGLLPSPLSALAPPPTMTARSGGQAIPESAPTPLLQLAFALPNCPE